MTVTVIVNLNCLFMSLFFICPDHFNFYISRHLCIEIHSDRVQIFKPQSLYYNAKLLRRSTSWIANLLHAQMMCAFMA